MSPYGGEERRRSGRIAAKRPILISPLDTASPRPTAAVTFSLSRYGCGVRCSTGFEVGSQVLIDFEGKKMEGQVSFLLKSSAIDGYEMGIAFNEDASGFWGETFEPFPG